MMKLILVFALLVSNAGCHGVDNTATESGHNYDRICIEGHVYYSRSTGHLGYLAPKLQHDGRPVSCGK